MKIDLNTILIIAGFVVLMLFGQSDNSDINSSIKVLNNKLDSLDNKLIDLNTDSLENNINILKHEIEIFTIDSIDYIKDRDSLRAKYNPR